MAEGGYQVLARKWRPQSFEDVVGQEHVTRTLRNAITQGRVHHAFLFIGSRGIGKTTTARILAKALNCSAGSAATPDPCGECENCRAIALGSHIDVMEIDGASNNSVNDVREIRENVRMLPSMGRYKIYIIDEVHQLSSGAFNALLKTLEEPPPHAVFILATTEAHKVPPTIVSRCQRHDFRRVAAPVIVALLRGIIEKEGLEATDEALYAVARASEGGVRDAESILDQLISYVDGAITFQDARDVLGIVDSAMLHRLCDAVLDKEIAGALGVVEEAVSAGMNLSEFIREIIQYLRNLLVCKSGAAEALLHLPEDETEALQSRAARFRTTELIRLIEQFAELTKGFDWQVAQRVALETLLIRVSQVSVDRSVDAVIEKLLALGAGGAGGSGAGGSAPNPSGAGPARAAVARRPPAERDRGGDALEGGADAAAPIPEPPPPEHWSAEEEGAPPADFGAKRAPRPVAVTEDTLQHFWKRMVAYLRMQQDLTLGVRASMGRAAAIEGDALVLSFAPEQAGAMRYFEQPDARVALEAALAALTTNLRRVRVESGAEATPSAAPLIPDPAHPVYPAVSAEDAERALEDPHVARVLEVFKGRIAEVRKEVSAAHPQEG